MHNCICFTIPCINSLVPSSVTREYHFKLLELLHLLQCIAAHLQRKLVWVSRETRHRRILSGNFRLGRTQLKTDSVGPA